MEKAMNTVILPMIATAMFQAKGKPAGGLRINRENRT